MPTIKLKNREAGLSPADWARSYRRGPEYDPTMRIDSNPATRRKRVMVEFDEDFFLRLTTRDAVEAIARMLVGELVKTEKFKPDYGKKMITESELMEARGEDGSIKAMITRLVNKD